MWQACGIVIVEEAYRAIYAVEVLRPNHAIGS